MVLDSIPGTKLAETAPENVGITAAVGSSDRAARADHVHDTAPGFIDNANKFAAGVVDAAALANNAVETTKIKDGNVTPVKLSFGTWQKIAETTVSAAVTTVSFTNLDINTDKAYIFVIKCYNPTANDTHVKLFINNDTTVTNYYTQRLTGEGTTVSSARVNDSWAFIIPPNSSQLIYILIEIDPQGYPKWFTFQTAKNTSSILVNHLAATKTGTVTNITQIDFTGAVNNVIGVNSNFMLFKVSA
jgi:hypothetical protein